MKNTWPDFMITTTLDNPYGELYNFLGYIHKREKYIILN